MQHYSFRRAASLACAAIVLPTFLTAITSRAARALAEEAGADEPPEIVWIYRDAVLPGERDARTASERLFSFGGYMPQERVNQIRVNTQRPVDPDKPAMGNCIEFLFEIQRPTDWQGVYALAGDQWGDVEGLDIPKLMGVPADAPLLLKYVARGEGTVTFKIGGVTSGKYPSSLKLALEPESGATKLGPAFREVSIPLVARQLTNLIDPFCVVMSGLDNRGRDVERGEVDDIRIERARKAKPKSLRTGWREKLRNSLLIAYTPTGFDPTVDPVKQPAVDDIRADLQAIRAFVDAAGIRGSKAGIVLYGCHDGLERIPQIAREFDLSVVLGIFNPASETEVRNAIELLKQTSLEDAIIACCVGNESTTFRRATFDQIARAVERLRRVRAVPMTTTEIVQAYGNKRLFDPAIADFTLVNAHALFAGVNEPKAAAGWAAERIRDLIDLAPEGHLIVVKEVGWPRGPQPFTPEQQRTYWETLFADDVAKKVNIAIFDGISNVPWKHENLELANGEAVDIGQFWPALFDSQRQPFENANVVLNCWKAVSPARAQ